MKFKRIIAAALSLAVIFGTSAVYGNDLNGHSLTVNAETDKNGREYSEGEYYSLTYHKYSDHIVISHCSWGAFNVDIPPEIDGLPVTEIGEYAFTSCSNLFSITIPDSITTIGNDAFTSCSRLAHIVIPDSVTNLGDNLFVFCTNLQSVTLPSGIKSIRSMTFYGCSKLSEITIPDSVINIEDRAFLGCEGLENIEFPDSVTTLGVSSFWYCNSLTSVTLPKNITSIGNGAFGNCSKLSKVTFLNPKCELSNVTTISNDAESTSQAVRGVYYGTIRGYDESTAQAYAEEYGYSFESLGEAPVQLGDVDYNGVVDGNDASKALTAYAKSVTGQDSGLTTYQTKAADIDGNGTVDGNDASAILSYYAYTMTQGTDSFEDFLKNRG